MSRDFPTLLGTRTAATNFSSRSNVYRVTGVARTHLHEVQTILSPGLKSYGTTLRQ
jgi:hypothetical protein